RGWDHFLDRGLLRALGWFLGSRFVDTQPDLGGLDHGWEPVFGRIFDRAYRLWTYKGEAPACESRDRALLARRPNQPPGGGGCWTADRGGCPRIWGGPCGCGSCYRGACRWPSCEALDASARLYAPAGPRPLHLI